MQQGDILRGIVHNYYFRHNPSIRTKATKRQYDFALKDFDDSLGHPATLADLTDDAIAGLLAFLQAKGLAAKTCNERAGRILALWRFLCQRGRMDRWPLPQKLVVPRRAPIAWTRTELDALLLACGRQRGMLGDIPASWWWISLHLVLWDSGERISALMACKWEWLSEGWLNLPAECRKGMTEDKSYQLSAEALEALECIRRPKRELIWPWPNHPLYIWRVYCNLRRRAGLATDRRSSFHRMRRSVASHFEAAGGNATELLGHSDRRLTKSAYLDARFVKSPQAVDRLFRLSQPHDRSKPPGQ